MSSNEEVYVELEETVKDKYSLNFTHVTGSPFRTKVSLDDSEAQTARDVLWEREKVPVETFCTRLSKYYEGGKHPTALLLSQEAKDASTDVMAKVARWTEVSSEWKAKQNQDDQMILDTIASGREVSKGDTYKAILLQLKLNELLNSFLRRDLQAEP